MDVWVSFWVSLTVLLGVLVGVLTVLDVDKVLVPVGALPILIYPKRP
jgi:hypothetical protein